MTRFSLVRHGSYDLLDVALGGRAAHPLNATGRAEAARLAAALGGQAVVASPVRRAQETAQPIAAALGLILETDPAFAEIDFAGWTGATFADLRGASGWHDWNAFRSMAQVPGGEAMLAVQARAVAAIARLAAVWPDGEVVVVSHGDVIKAILAHLLGAPLDLLRRIEVGPGSISRVLLTGDDARVLGINLPPPP